MDLKVWGWGFKLMTWTQQWVGIRQASFRIRQEKEQAFLTDKQTRKAYKYTSAALHFSIYCTLTASMFQFHLFLKNSCQKNGVGVNTTFYLGDTYPRGTHVPAMQYWSMSYSRSDNPFQYKRQNPSNYKHFKSNELFEVYMCWNFMYYGRFVKTVSSF